MRFPILLLLLFFQLCVYAQRAITFHTNSDQQGVYSIYVTNNGIAAYTVYLNCQLTGMDALEDLPVTRVVLPGTSLKMVSLRANTSAKEQSYSYSYKVALGNWMNAYNLDSFVYRLPFSESQCAKIMKSNDKIEYAGQFAFAMQEGSAVICSRNGVIAELKADETKGCSFSDCGTNGNYLTILHQDGSYASYYHFKHEGTSVSLGQQVKTGDTLGFLGNNGYNKIPHLCFKVAVASAKGSKTLSANLHFNGKTIEAHEEQYVGVNCDKDQFSASTRKRLPDFVLKTGNSFINNDSLKGKVVFFNLWFAGCKPCIAELESLNMLFDQFKNDDSFRFISLSIDNVRTIEQQKQKYNIHYDVFSTTGRFCRKLTGHGIFPTSMIVDKKGNIRLLTQGAAMSHEANVKRVMQEYYPVIMNALAE